MAIVGVSEGLRARPGGVGPGREAGAAIACLVPLGVFGFAWLASRERRSIEAWVTASVVGTTAVICGSILAIKAGKHAGR
ncbi:MAG: hypothetical protein U0800_19385 [Isosphaeraceae bacterium]